MPASPGDATPIDGIKPDIKDGLGLAGEDIKVAELKEELKDEIQETTADSDPQVCPGFFCLATLFNGPFTEYHYNPSSK